MARGKRLTWAELRVGLFVLVGLLVLAVAIFYVTGAGVFGPKYHLRTFLPEVSGLATGAPVRLDGVEIGNVDRIALAPREHGKPPDRLRNIEIGMKLDRKYQNDVLTDSTAMLVTEGLLGNRYVNIQRGFTGVPLKDGQIVTGTEEKAIKEVVERSADVLSNLRALSDEVRDLIAGVQAGKGSVGKLLMTDEMSTKVENAIDQVNAVLADLRAQKGTLGKLLYDPTLYDQAKEALSNGNAVIGDVRAGKGTLGKLATDETLYNKLRDTSNNLAEASSKLNQNNNTVGRLFSDPQLYDNLNAASADLRQFLEEFRKNPKKYLTIKLTLF